MSVFTNLCRCNRDVWHQWVCSQLLLFLAYSKVEKEAEIQRFLFCLRFLVFLDAGEGCLNSQTQNLPHSQHHPWAPLCSSANSRPEKVTQEFLCCQGPPMARVVEIENQNFLSSVCCEEVNSHRSSKSSEKRQFHRHHIHWVTGSIKGGKGSLPPVWLCERPSHKLMSCL